MSDSRQRIRSMRRTRGLLIALAVFWAVTAIPELIQGEAVPLFLSGTAVMMFAAGAAFQTISIRRAERLADEARRIWPRPQSQHMIVLGDGWTLTPLDAPECSTVPGAFSLSGGMTLAEMDLAVTRLAAAVGRCAHPHAVPVDLATGERVAWLCPGCDAQLPAGWAND